MKKSIFRFTLITIFALIASGCQNQPTQQIVVATATQLPDTPVPVPPSQTPLPPTLTASPTDAPTATLTPMPAILIVGEDSVCRTGPGLNYDIRTYLTTDATANITGFVEGEPIWWLAEFRADGADQPTVCWISDQVVTASGALALLPLLTPPPSPTPSPVPTLVGQPTYYYLIAENTGGPIGCGDSLISIYPGTVKTGDLEADVRAVLNALFSNHHKYYNGLYNALHESSLRATDLWYSGSEANINLGGNFVRPKDDCESQRMRAQVWYTAQQFPETGRPIIWLNNALLGDLLDSCVLTLPI